MSAKRDDVTDKVMPKSTLGIWIRRAVFVLMGLSFLLVVATGALLYRLRSGPLALPGAQATVTRLAQKALNDFDVRIGEVSLVATQKGLTAQVQLTDLQLFTKSGQKVAEFPIMRAKLDLVQTLLQGIEIETIEIIGAEFRILRDMNGQYNILPPGEKNTGIIKPEMIFDAANIAAKKAPLSSLRLIEMIDTNLVYIDQIKSRVWRTSKTFIKSEREGDVITAFADVVMSTEDRADTTVGLRFSYGLGNDFFGFGFKFDQASTIDLADQVPALDWLRGFDATVTGSLNAEVKVDGVLDKLSGVLETDKGQLRDSPEAEPVKFSNVKAYFEYAKETDSLDFTQITAKSAVGSVTGEGVVSLFRNPAGVVDALSGFVKLSELQIYPEGVFSRPLVFDSAKANVHMTLSPFSATLESGVLTKGAQRITMTGSSVAGDTYWNSSYFIQFNELSRDDVLGYWPLAAKEKTRKWIDQNILEGVAKNGVGQLRTRNGRASVDLKFDIDQGQVRYLKTLPVLKGAVGQGHLTEKMFKAKLSSGYVIAPNGGRLDVFDSEFYVPDLTVKLAVGEVTLNVRGGLPAALSVLDEKPFEYLKKSNLKPTLAHGLVRASGTLTVPLIKGTKPEDVQFSVQAEATNVTSKTLIKDRTVTADKVFVVADDTKVELTGEVMLDGLPTQTRWVLPIGKQYKKRSELTSDIILNEANLRQFGVRFDKGTITGATPARLKVALQPKTAPRYSLSSNMVGMGLNISPLSWSKAKKSKGNLLVKGTMGDRFTVDSLSIKTSGLSATGTVSLNADNSFNRADFTSLTVGNWLNANVSITSTGPKRTKISVNSGSADLRNISFSKGAKTGAPMDISLDRLILADGIVLTGLRAKLRNEPGLRGTYSARINGGAGITGSVFPQKNGTAAEINAVNAGEVLRSANLYTKGVGGDLRLVLIPLEKEGFYKGTFQIRKAKVKQDNILADMLNAISVIGLVQQLSGDGIVFELVDGEFTLKPQGVELRKTSAVGVSIGITLDGNYNSGTKDVKFEGVITPLYALNGTLERVFGKLFGRRKGEGLFSFVYNVSGPSSDPRITVNPFSILTPGVFREIFRTKMPDVGKADIPAVDNTAAPQAQTPQVNAQEPIPEDGSTAQEVDR